MWESGLEVVAVLGRSGMVVGVILISGFFDG